MKYAFGSKAFAICDRCGLRYKYTAVDYDWRGLKVCQDCYEPKEPQLEPSPAPVDAIALYDPRPDRREPLEVPVGLKVFPPLENQLLQAQALVGDVSVQTNVYTGTFMIVTGLEAGAYVGEATVSISAVSIAVSGVYGLGYVGSATVLPVATTNGVAGTAGVGSVTVNAQTGTQAGVPGLAATGSAGSVTVSNVAYSAPYAVALDNTSILEGSAEDTLIGHLTSSDADPGDTFTYALTTSYDASFGGRFKIVGNELRVGATALVYSEGAQYVVNIVSTDSHGLSYTKTFFIDILPSASTSDVETTASAWAAANGLLNITWSIPKKDYPVGRVSTASLKLPVNGVDGMVVSSDSDGTWVEIRQFGTYSDYDFRGCTVYIYISSTNVNNIVFQNCLFDDGYRSQVPVTGCNYTSGTILRTDCTYRYCTFRGTNQGTRNTGQIINNFKGKVKVVRCDFSGFCGDPITCAGGWVIQNYVDGMTWAFDAHFDFVNYSSSSGGPSVGPLYQYQNFVDVISPLGAPNYSQFNSMLKLQDTGSDPGPTHGFISEQNIIYSSDTTASHNPYYHIQNQGGSGEQRYIDNRFAQSHDGGLASGLIAAMQGSRRYTDNVLLNTGDAMNQNPGGTVSGNNDMAVTKPSAPVVTLNRSGTSVTPIYTLPTGASRVEGQWKPSGESEWLDMPTAANTNTAITGLTGAHEFRFRACVVVGGLVYNGDWAARQTA